MTVLTMVAIDDITLAASRLCGIAVRTPLIPYPHQQPGRELYLKPESLQPIGSFKLRGAYNKIASLADAERRNGVISYSSGNHAQGVAYAARALGVKAVIVMPANAPQIKIDSTRALGAEVVFVGPASSERKARAEDLAREHGYAIIPPYNDEKIIAGAGTAGLEILADLPDADLVLVPVGGGGLISGIASAFKLSGSHAKVIGVEPELASDAQASFRSGRIVEFSADQTSRTLADGLRTQSVGEINFDHIRRFVDDIVTVSESEILAAIRTLALDAKLVAEPSGAVTFAAFRFRAGKLPPARKTVAVISGGNIDPALLAGVLSQTASALE
ncbi:MAG: threonine/serine dehydratase [Terriglobales bacterium]